jgi:hypothetical protein
MITFRNHNIAAIEKADWGPLGLSVIVRNGHVHLSGIIINERFAQRRWWLRKTFRASGRFHDHLCWVEPMSGGNLNSQEDGALLRANWADVGWVRRQAAAIA